MRMLSLAITLSLIKAFTLIGLIRCSVHAGGKLDFYHLVQHRSAPIQGDDVEIQLDSENNVQPNILPTPTPQNSKCSPRPTNARLANHLFNTPAGGNMSRLTQCRPNDFDDFKSWTRPAFDASFTRNQSCSGWRWPLTTEAQQRLWRHQHPADCSSKRFLVYSGPSSSVCCHGVGSLIHVMTVLLMDALNSDRILIEHPHTTFVAAEDEWCAGTRGTLDSCYFEPLSNCTLTDDQLASAHVLDPEIDMTHFETDQARYPPIVHADRMWAILSLRQRQAPREFLKQLAAVNVPDGSAYYWWRGQAAAYIVRPNKRTRTEIARRYGERLRGGALSPNCISVYVRHGDKGTEVKLASDAEFEAAVQHLRTVDPHLTNQLFVSTEDPVTLAHFKNSPAWHVSYVDMPRKPDASVSNMHYMKQYGYANEVLDGLLNLDLAIECDGYVASLTSNWARLIDELRSTVRCRADAAYVDAMNPGSESVDFDWRRL